MCDHALSLFKNKTFCLPHAASRNHSSVEYNVKIKVFQRCMTHFSAVEQNVISYLVLFNSLIVEGINKFLNRFNLHLGILNLSPDGTVFFCVPQEKRSKTTVK